MDKDRLIPAYALSHDSPSPRHNLMIYDDRGKKPKEIVLANAADVHQLQRALTGYRVHHGMSVTRWCLNNSSSPGNSGHGMLQLWQYKPLPPMPAMRGSEISSTISPDRSPGSPSSSLRSPGSPLTVSPDLAVHDENGWSTAFGTSRSIPHEHIVATHPEHRPRNSPFAEMIRAQTSDGSRYSTGSSFRTRPDSLVTSPTSRALSHVAQSPKVMSHSGNSRSQRNSSTFSGKTFLSQSSVTSPVQGPRSAGVEILKPELPVLVIMTLRNGRYSFVHLTCKLCDGRRNTTVANPNPVSEDICVEPRACGCRSAKRHCDRVVLESKKNNFPVRILSAEQQGGQGLESWDLSVFRIPQPEKLSKTTVNGKIKTMELKFSSEDGGCQSMPMLQISADGPV